MNSHDHICMVFCIQTKVSPPVSPANQESWSYLFISLSPHYGLKLHQGRFRLKEWSGIGRLPRAVVESPSLEGFKNHVDVALRLSRNDGDAFTVGLDYLRGLLNLNDSMICGRVPWSCLQLQVPGSHSAWSMDRTQGEVCLQRTGIRLQSRPPSVRFTIPAEY